MPETAHTLNIINRATGDLIVSVEVEDARILEDHALAAETAEQVIADRGLNYAVRSIGIDNGVSVAEVDDL